MFESVNRRTDGCTHGRTPARLVYYKLTMSLGSGELMNRFVGCISSFTKKSILTEFKCAPIDVPAL